MSRYQMLRRFWNLMGVLQVGDSDSTTADVLNDLFGACAFDIDMIR